LAPWVPPEPSGRLLKEHEFLYHVLFIRQYRVDFPPQVWNQMVKELQMLAYILKAEKEEV
jgi:hypothetical protein